jgi:hypothetical protein
MKDSTKSKLCILAIVILFAIGSNLDAIFNYFGGAL